MKKVTLRVEQINDKLFQRVSLSIEFTCVLHIGESYNVFEYSKESSQFVVAEAERTLEEHSLSLTFFTVFTIPVFLLVISLLIVSGFIEKLVAFEKFKGEYDS